VAEATPLESRCPRCGGAFHCGIGDPAGVGPCACTTLTLSPALRAELGTRFQVCLCLACLRELAADPTRVSCAPCTPASSA
jgi:Cysteine-rich CWC